VSNSPVVNHPHYEDSGANFSIEAVVLGRNDDYEPNWRKNLFASIAYNRRLFEGSRVDFRVAFVEWNPPAERPLLSPELVERFPFLRALVIDRSVHQQLSQSAQLTMMLNFAYNPALRTSQADFVLITSGDLFYGRGLADRIVGDGLRGGCLYRAERVNVRPTLDFSRSGSEEIEASQNVVAVDSCSSPPYDQPPFTNACGDFIMMDRVSMLGIRGFDESIRFARAHLDSRCCTTALQAGMECELLGQIFHVDHAASMSNLGSAYPMSNYDFNLDLPYLNPPNWGLADARWADAGERTVSIGPELTYSMPGLARMLGFARTSPDFARRAYPAPDIREANAVTQKLIELKERTTPSRPTQRTSSALRLFWPTRLSIPGYWSATQKRTHGRVQLTSAPDPWAYSATLSIPRFGPQEKWYWVKLRLRIAKGQFGVSLLAKDTLLHEQLISAGEPTDVYLPLDDFEAPVVLFRNASPDGASVCELMEHRIVYQRRTDYRALLMPERVDMMASR